MKDRLKTKDEKSTHLTYTGLIGELEHLKIKTRLIDETFASVDVNPSTRVPGNHSPGPWSQGIFLFFWWELIFFQKKFFFHQSKL
jgi:hypothetical protein